jgi:hypothetical protein
MKKTTLTAMLFLTAAALACVAGLGRAQSQQSDIIVTLTGGQKRAIALPDFRGAATAGPLMDVFNRTVFDDVQRSGVFVMAAKSFYPLNPPQQETDLKAAPPPPPPP